MYCPWCTIHGILQAAWGRVACEDDLLRAHGTYVHHALLCHISPPGDIVMTSFVSGNAAQGMVATTVDESLVAVHRKSLHMWGRGCGRQSQSIARVAILHAVSHERSSAQVGNAMCVTGYCANSVCSTVQAQQRQEREAEVAALVAKEKASKTEDELDEQELKTLRDWDDFKDEHPTGYGNSKLRPCAL
jgi:hypothetical protein